MAARTRLSRVEHVAEVFVAGAIAGAYLATRRLAARLPLLSGSQAAAEALLLQLRRIGLPLLGFAFFVLWAFAYVALWDFFYYSVSTGPDLAGGRHRRRLARRPLGDDDRDAHGVRSARDVPLELRRLAARPPGARARRGEVTVSPAGCSG
jgi:hypothetical protein